MSIKISIIGTGFVGAAYAYRLTVSGLASTIVLYDINSDRVKAEALELNHCQPLEHGPRVFAGELEDIQGSQLVVLTAGINSKPGQTRLDLAKTNLGIYSELIPQIANLCPETIVLVAANPLDVISYATWKYSHFPWQRVIGSGTLLDSARFGYHLSEKLGVHADDVQVMVLGEHGDSQVAVTSSITIQGINLETYCNQNQIQLTSEHMDEIKRKTRESAATIIAGKGATYFAIASSLMKITESILLDRKWILPVSSLVNGPFGIQDVYLSLPCVVGCNGLEAQLNLELNSQEIAALQASANIIRNFTQTI